jgi:hypothetical protein
MRNETASRVSSAASAGLQDTGWRQTGEVALSLRVGAPQQGRIADPVLGNHCVD